MYAEGADIHTHFFWLWENIATSRPLSVDADIHTHFFWLWENIATSRPLSVGGDIHSQMTDRKNIRFFCQIYNVCI